MNDKNRRILPRNRRRLSSAPITQPSQDASLESILELSRILSSNLDAETVWEAFHDYLNVTFDTTSFFVGLYDYERDRLTIPVVSEDGLPASRPPLPVTGFSRVVILHGVELDLRDVDAENEQLEALGVSVGENESPPEHEPGRWARSWLGVPIRSRQGEITGLIALQHTIPHNFTDADLSMLRVVSSVLSMSLDNLRLGESERERRTIASALMEIGQLAGGNLDDSDMLESLLDQFQRAVRYNSAAVLLPQEDNPRGVVIAASHDPDAFLTGTLLSYSEFSPLAQVIRSQQPLVLTDVTDFSGWWQGIIPAAEHFASWIIVPMTVQNQVVGLILLAKISSSGYTQKDASNAFALARQGAIAFETTHLQTQQRENVHTLQQRARHLGSIHRINSVITSSLDLDEIFRTTAELLTELFESDHCGIVMINDAGDEAVLAAEYPDTGSTGIRIEMEANATMEWLRRYGTAVVLADVEDVSIDEVTRSALRRLGIQSTLIAPLIMRDRVIGTIGIDMIRSQRQFTSEECETLVTIAGQVAIAVSQAKLYEAALDANRLKSAFLANTSHELRTPLNAIIGYSDMLLGGFYGNLNDQQRDRVNHVYTNGRHLLSLIDNVLDLSKIEAGQVTLSLENLRASEVLPDLLTTLPAEAAEKNLSVEVTVSPDEPLVRADRFYLSEIVENLLANAVKFTPAGSIRIEVQPVTTAQAGAPKRLLLPQSDWLALRVIDTGIGIRPQDHEIIFESFRQVDGSAERAFNGPGLGLAITRRLVEMHEGCIWVSSTPGVGSTFTVLLPVLRPPEPETPPQTPA